MRDRPPSVKLPNSFRSSLCQHSTMRACLISFRLVRVEAPKNCYAIFKDMGFSCINQDVRFIKSLSSKFTTRVTTPIRLCRFCNSALLHSNLLSQMVFTIVNKMSLNIKDGRTFLRNQRLYFSTLVNLMTDPRKLATSLVKNMSNYVFLKLTIRV